MDLEYNNNLIQRLMEESRELGNFRKQGASATISEGISQITDLIRRLEGAEKKNVEMFDILGELDDSFVLVDAYGDGAWAKEAKEKARKFIRQQQND